jgi:hypothetical protein
LEGDLEGDGEEERKGRQRREGVDVDAASMKFCGGKFYLQRMSQHLYAHYQESDPLSTQRISRIGEGYKRRRRKVSRNKYANRCKVSLDYLK